jgi:hypothetical protein
VEFRKVRKAAVLTVWFPTVAGLPLSEVEAGYWCLPLWFRLSWWFAQAVERLYPVRKAM